MRSMIGCALAACGLVAACRTETQEAPAVSKLVREPGPAEQPKAAPRVAAAPSVQLSGATTLPTENRKAGPRVFSKALRTWIHAEPNGDATKLGYLRAGASSATSAKAA